MSQPPVDDLPCGLDVIVQAIWWVIMLAVGVAQAGLLDLERVPGVNRAVAKAIYDFFHDGA